MVLLVEYLPKFKHEASNFLGLRQSVYSLFLSLDKFLLVVFRLAYVLFIYMHDQDIKTEMNPILNPRAAGPEGSLIGIPGTPLSILLLQVIFFS